MDGFRTRPIGRVKNASETRPTRPPGCLGGRRAAPTGKKKYPAASAAAAAAVGGLRPGWWRQRGTGRVPGITGRYVSPGQPVLFTGRACSAASAGEDPHGQWLCGSCIMPPPSHDEQKVGRGNKGKRTRFWRVRADALLARPTVHCPPDLPQQATTANALPAWTCLLTVLCHGNDCMAGVVLTHRK
eukprot:gene9847-biopygen15277